VVEVLMQQPRAWHHGYELSKLTGLKSGTLYPLLIRLSDQRLLESEWQPPERAGKPHRHAYRLTAKGLRFAREVVAERHSGAQRRNVAAVTP
jgi:PadR family transcriptional regulator, regulatory protein PadR